MNPYLRAMRLDRWPRSMAIFVGTAAFFFLERRFLLKFSVPVAFLRAGLAFALTWFISTANYVVNEIADAPFDAHHPTKRLRPLVKGEIRIFPFALIGLALTVAGLAIGFLVFDRPFFFSLLGLLAAGFVYNLRPVRTKDIPFLDSISESLNNPIRFLVGWFAFAPASLLPPLSLLLCWWSFGNFLMVAKRLSEFRFLREKAADYRTSHKRYSTASLTLGMAVSAGVFIVTYFLFALSFKLNYVLLISPAVLLLLFLIFRRTLREEEVMEEPEKLLRRPVFAAYTAGLLVIYLIAFFLERPGR